MGSLRTEIIKLFMRGNCVFKSQDAVQEIGGDGELMIVVEVLYAWGLETPLVDCTWRDGETDARRVKTFRPSQLRFFDWEHARLMGHAKAARAKEKMPTGHR